MTEESDTELNQLEREVQSVRSDLLTFFPRLWAFFAVALVAATYRIWFPISDYPRVPLLDVSLDATTEKILSWLFPLLLLVSLVTVALVRKRSGFLWLFVVVCFAACFVLDQHRLQPWAYQTAIYAMIFALVAEERSKKLLLPLAASVYFFSAAGKFDYQFAHTVGPELLGTFCKNLGLDLSKLEPETQSKLSLLMPAIELTASLLLLSRWTRRWAGVMLVGMHLVLLWILGPWGLNHSTGVLVWNVALLTQAIFLFVIPRWSADVDERKRYRKLFGWQTQSTFSRLRVLAAGSIVALAVVLPFGERFGYWDHWLSWALYSPHNSRVEVEVHISGLTRLPASLQQEARASDESDRWLVLSLDEWSLGARGVPIYPQARYQLALAVLVSDLADLGDGIRCRVKSVADRWTGKREEQWLTGEKAMREALNEFWLTSDSISAVHPKDPDEVVR